MLNPPRRFRLLDELDDRGFLLAVATGKCRVGLARALAQHGIADLFAASRCADEGFPKPHPDMLLAQAIGRQSLEDAALPVVFHQSAGSISRLRRKKCRRHARRLSLARDAHHGTDRKRKVRCRDRTARHV